MMRVLEGRQNETKIFTARHHRSHQFISFVRSRAEESANRLADLWRRSWRTALRASGADQHRQRHEARARVDISHEAYERRDARCRKHGWPPSRSTSPSTTAAWRSPSPTTAAASTPRRTNSGGFGLTGMRERVELAGGELDIDSGSSGTTVKARLPVRGAPRATPSRRRRRARGRASRSRPSARRPCRRRRPGARRRGRPSSGRRPPASRTARR